MVSLAILKNAHPIHEAAPRLHEPEYVLMTFHAAENQRHGPVVEGVDVALSYRVLG